MVFEKIVSEEQLQLATDAVIWAKDFGPFTTHGGTRNVLTGEIAKFFEVEFPIAADFVNLILAEEFKGEKFSSPELRDSGIRITSEVIDMRMLCTWLVLTARYRKIPIAEESVRRSINITRENLSNVFSKSTAIFNGGDSMHISESTMRTNVIRDLTSMTFLPIQQIKSEARKRYVDEYLFNVDDKKVIEEAYVSHAMHFALDALNNAEMNRLNNFTYAIDTCKFLLLELAEANQDAILRIVEKLAKVKITSVKEKLELRRELIWEANAIQADINITSGVLLADKFYPENKDR